MRIGELIERLRQGRPANFIWGAGSSRLVRESITIPADPEVRNAAKKYDADPLLSQIKRNFFHKTAGLEDVHSCLAMLNDYERKQVLTWRTNWANLCMAELLRAGRVARVLTTNFDGNLVCQTAILRMRLPLYGRDYPELADAQTPCIYLLGMATAETVAGLVQRGAASGPWIVVGSSGRHHGIAETLAAVDGFDEGLYWVGHFHEPPPAQLKDKAEWISGFDADSFMAYLLRGLGEFPKFESREVYLGNLAKQRYPEQDYRQIYAEAERMKRAPAAEVEAFAEKLMYDSEMSVRAGRSAFALGFVARQLADARRPREVRPLLVKAAELTEWDAPGDAMCGFAEICLRLARFSHAPEAHQWHTRANAVYEQMDFGPSCGAPLPYGHLPHWAEFLAEWSCAEDSDAIFERARLTYLEAIEKWRNVKPSRLSFAVSTAQSGVRRTIRALILALHRRGRLEEARPWIDELRDDEAEYRNLLAKHLVQSRMVGEAEEQFVRLLQLVPDQKADVLCNWASGLGELERYDEAEAKFREGEEANPESVTLHKNWSSILVVAKRWDEARRHAERADSLEAGQGSYNLACVAAELDDRAVVERWLDRAAEHGKIPPLGHILGDHNFAGVRGERWFSDVLDRIFGCGPAPAG